MQTVGYESLYVNTRVRRVLGINKQSNRLRYVINIEIGKIPYNSSIQGILCKAIALRFQASLTKAICRKQAICGMKRSKKRQQTALLYQFVRNFIL